VKVNGLLNLSSRISSSWSTPQFTRPSSSSILARGQWGLLGGSSNPDKGGTSTKPSKLASLAQSSRGAFGKRVSQQQINIPSKLDSVSRLAALSSGASSKKVPAIPPKSVTNRNEHVVTPSGNGSQNNVMESDDVKPSTDPCADHLLGYPSVVANSLFHLWVVPQGVADSLLRIHANPYLLIVPNETSIQTAFSSASPDDVIQATQKRAKGSS
jgi:hypothetical protein